MNKGELITAIAKDSGLNKTQAESALNSAIAVITKTLVDGDSVVIVGFGKLEVRDRQEREGRNPKTGEPITIPATKAVTFTAGKELKETVNS